MVRFTLKDVMKAVSMRLDLDPCDPVQEISCIANEYWGSDGFLIRNGYNLIDEGEQVGMRISEGDVIELIPDPISL